MTPPSPPRPNTPAEHRWAVAGPAQWERVSASGFRAWPDGPGQDDTGDADGAVAWRSFASRHDAEQWARAHVVPLLGTARVLERQPSGVVSEHARYERALPDEDFDRAERSSGLRVPTGWRQYLQRPSWLAKGHLQNDEPVWVYTPAEAVDLTQVWLEPTGDPDLAHVLVVGSDGAREMLVVDVREEDSPVYLLSAVTEGWEDAVEQATDTAAFIAAVEGGTFEYRFGDEEE